jgi:hypothetical protein
MNDIRKLIVGNDMKCGMNYVKGQYVLDQTHTISVIKKNKDKAVEIWIKNSSEEYLWKEFNLSMPVAIEYNIDF